ncbi:MFS transporter [Rhodopila globiformis]|uniref:Putative tartrate transporter n=1 Tax=Rhodopila globiformis TaxID=1071 RepID=A0A2S6N073_RHOGL|nr:MFS transporter [Rhodopila globiformis]PPQ28025.1 MFS transporter [Rhodopila globiformis]
MDTIEKRTLAKVSWRLVPFLMLCYFIAYLDRVNVSVAALTMNKDLAISATAYGFGAGVFFFSYFIFEVPSNLALERFGARRWIARIMLTWGLLSGAMALVRGEYSFYLVRVLLGAAEAGFFPGIIFYLTLWFPGSYRARIVGWFMAAIPLSSVLGLPISGLILGMHGLGGLAGWQWLFVIEAAPALILAGAVWFYLTDRPEDAHWLDPEERTWLARRLAQEAQQKQEVHGISVAQALFNPKVLALSLVYFGAVAANYGIAFWLPQIVKGFGLSNAATGFVSAVPYVVGAIGMVLWSRSSDERMERKGHTAVAFLIAAAGIAGSTLVSDPTLKMVALSIGAFGVFAVLPVFWTFPTAFLHGAAAAAGIAVINSVGNLAGFFGPFIMGWLKDLTGNFASGLWAIAACAVMGMVIVLLLRHDTHLEKAPPHAMPAAE